MKLIPKSYYHNKTVLSLLAMNAAMLVVTLIFTIGGIDSENARSVIQYRAGLSDAITRGQTSYLNSFAVYAIVVTLMTIGLSIRLFTHRHRLAISVLGSNLILLLLTIVVFNALTGVQ